MKLKRLLLISGVVGLVAYGALKGAVYYQVKNQMDRLGAIVAPFASLEYDGIGSSLAAGSVAVNGITLTPREALVGIQVEQVELKGDGPGFLLSLLTGFKPDQPPERAQLQIRRMSTPLLGGYLDYWHPAGSSSPPDLCTLGGLIWQTEIERLGFRQRMADVRLRYDLDRRSGELTLQMGYYQDGLAALSVETTLAGLVGMNGAKMPQMERFSLLYRIDPDYMRGAVNYCAKESGLAPAAFIEQLFAVRPPELGKQLGFVPGEGLRKALRQLVSRPGELLLTAVPDKSFSPARLQQYQPQELVRQLGIGLSVNDQPVTDLSFSLPKRDKPFTELLDQVTSGATGEAPQAASSVSPPPARPRARFMETPVEQLGRYVGSHARLYASDRDEPQRGILMGLNNNRMELEQRLYGGKMTLYVPLGKISRAEVLRWEKSVVDETAR
ncbi:hypothetical protein [Sedimenticola thiotaurini]|uniref:DUF945 family protein n=1 Tax=Sedimenticola thiotaurini TaxID=1543721 RepID=A0A0F7JZW7_9GAMM|nr:hypothetical protein [Sedimenticola thiotaurini]AKH21207.1 hypothetical protein AAY24_13495 [Sedimenticola thiotaurini]